MVVLILEHAHCLDQHKSGYLLDREKCFDRLPWQITFELEKHADSLLAGLMLMPDSTSTCKLHFAWGHLRGPFGLRLSGKALPAVFVELP